MTMTCSGHLQVDQPTKRWRLALKPNRSGFGLKRGLSGHDAIGSIFERVAAEAGVGQAGAGGGSDPGLRRPVPPQPFRAPVVAAGVATARLITENKSHSQ